MKSRRKYISQKGAVLVFALLVLVVGATILGGIAQLGVTQSVAGQTEWEAAARRVQLENSRALARQYILSQMWRGFGGLSRGSLDNSVTGGVGGFSITNVDPEVGFWLSLAQDGTDRVNPFNIFERGGFQSAWASGQLRSGTNNVPWGFQIRTRSPIVAGFAFVNHRNASNTWTASRYINMQQTNYASGFNSLPRMPVSSVTNSSIIGGAGAFTGLLAVPRAEAPFGNFYTNAAGVTTNLYVSGATTNAEVVLDLGAYDYYNPDGCLFYEVPSRVDMTNATGETQYTNPVTRLKLLGGADSTPVQVLVPESNTTLTNLVLSGSNLREVYFYHRGSVANLEVSTTGGNISFRIGMTLYCTADLVPAGALTMVGGVRTGSALRNSQGTVAFGPETNPSWRYDAIADRMMWLEDQRVR